MKNRLVPGTAGAKGKTRHSTVKVQPRSAHVHQDVKRTMYEGSQEFCRCLNCGETWWD